MNLPNNFNKLEISIKSTLDKLAKIDEIIDAVLTDVDTSKIRFTALTELMQVKLQYVQFLYDMQSKEKTNDSASEVLDTLKKATPELRDEFLLVWEKIIRYVESHEEDEFETIE